MAYRDPSDGLYKRNVHRSLGPADLHGETVLVYDIEPRPVALTISDARERGWDYFHPDYVPGGTWIRGGGKPERVPADLTSALPASEEAQPREVLLSEFRAAGGHWPPKKTWRDHQYEMSERSVELEREIQNAELDRDLLQALGGNPDQIKRSIELEVRTHRNELKKFVRAGDSIATGPRGCKKLREDKESEWRRTTEDAIALKQKHPRYTWEQIAARVGVPLSTLGRWRRALMAGRR